MLTPNMEIFDVFFLQFSNNLCAFVPMFAFVYIFFNVMCIYENLYTCYFVQLVQSIKHTIQYNTQRDE